MFIEVWSPEEKIWVLTNLERLSPGDVYRMTHPVTQAITGPWLVLDYPEVQCHACEFPEKAK